MHLVGFIIRIYHDARSPERQIRANHYAFFIQSSVISYLLGQNHLLSTLFLKCMYSFSLMDSLDLQRHHYTPFHNIV